MRYLILLILILLLAGCSGQTHTWSQSASASCSGFLCINSGNVTQEMPVPNANNVLLAAALLAVGCVLIIALALGGAL